MTMLPVPSYACRAEGWRLLGDIILQWLMARPGSSATDADRMRGRQTSKGFGYGARLQVPPRHPQPLSMP